MVSQTSPALSRSTPSRQSSSSPSSKGLSTTASEWKPQEHKWYIDLTAPVQNVFHRLTLSHAVMEYHGSDFVAGDQHDSVRAVQRRIKPEWLQKNGGSLRNLSPLAVCELAERTFQSTPVVECPIYSNNKHRASCRKTFVRAVFTSLHNSLAYSPIKQQFIDPGPLEKLVYGSVSWVW